MTVTVERAKCDEATYKEVMDACLPALTEYAVAPVNMKKTMEQGYRVLEQGMSFLAREETGAVVGVIGMSISDFWYSDEPILLNTVGPYVRPDQRFGVVGVRLMRAVRDLADEKDMLAFVWVMDTKRKRTTQASLFATVAGYVSVGHVIAMRRHREAVAAG